MPLPLSYPGLRCVLEHLEAVKRAHIIGRSPCLQKIDKLIPLCLENLYIEKTKLVINKLWITCLTAVTLDNLKNIYNKKVVFQSLYPFRIDIVPLIKYQIETEKATGTTLVIAVDDKRFIKKMLRKFKKAFGEYRSTLDGVNERFIPGLPKFSIPINNESRIQVYAIEDEKGLFKEDFPYNIIVKSISEISRI
ncbi:hypothetical protein GCK72_007890 [Caenorhabditis remanei]|uniref:DUF38 domain-containing protein n=1 Tax=Caenorhabditis remanei TaxID=31234 RepID=A0A6A5HID9_CAERE|nr:hypothetical protein GCK72_007890 [Caenorhabditis remanei]KAF1767930.1 hypothetical protein GCK72_007890 [Caenorhabditis remanei]